MGTTKKSAFTEEQNHLAEFAKAIGHPARIAILQQLFNRACICGDLVEVLPLAQSTVSQHLKELKNAGIIKGEIDGPRTCYCIDENMWHKVKAALNGFFEAFENRNGCC